MPAEPATNSGLAKREEERKAMTGSGRPCRPDVIRDQLIFFYIIRASSQHVVFGATGSRGGGTQTGMMERVEGRGRGIASLEADCERGSGTNHRS